MLIPNRVCLPKFVLWQCQEMGFVTHHGQEHTEACGWQVHVFCLPISQTYQYTTTTSLNESIQTHLYKFLNYTKSYVKSQNHLISLKVSAKTSSLFTVKGEKNKIFLQFRRPFWIYLKMRLKGNTNILFFNLHL